MSGPRSACVCLLFVLFSPVFTNPFSYENAYFFIRSGPSSTLKQPKTLIETTSFDAFFGIAFNHLVQSLLNQPDVCYVERVRLSVIRRLEMIINKLLAVDARNMLLFSKLPSEIRKPLT